MLYAEHMLTRFDSLGRQGAVIQAVENPMPATLYELYEASLVECQRRMLPTHREIGCMLLHWITFSYTPLVLDSVLSLLRYISEDESFNLEEIPEVFSRFLRIGGPEENYKAPLV